MLTKIIRFSSLLVIAFIMIEAWAFEQEEADKMLFLDSQLNSELPKRLRTTGDNIAAPGDVSLEGLAELNIAGSGQFSGPSLQNAVAKINKPVVIVDLRMESHGFVNFLPVSWYNESKSLNQGKKVAEIDVIEKSRMAVVAQFKRVKLYEIIDKRRGVIIDKRAHEVEVESVATEKLLVNSMGIPYVRLPILDHDIPEPHVVEGLVKFIHERPENRVIYYHCRAGSGRTTTIMAMHDMVINAKNVSFEDIIARHKLLGGRDLAYIDPTKSAARQQLQRDRLEFLREFYTTHRKLVA